MGKELVRGEMMQYIAMNESHVAAVAALEKICFSAPWSENSVRSELKNPLSCWIVAVCDGVVAGYVGSQTVGQESDMMNLAVSPEFRGQGIGRELVNALVSRLGENGASSLTLEVRASNTAAIGLYEQCGFLTVGRRPGYYRMPKEDALIMRKEWDV